MARIDYKRIFDYQRRKWEALTDDEAGGKYDTLVAGHYSENNHFVYELLQNAEDENATRIVFDYYSDKLKVYHNGKPFEQEDVEGICSFLNGTKDKDSAQQIGHFGLGFKSVFKYTSTPEVYSNEEAFRIIRYLLPEEIPNDGFPDNHFIITGNQRQKAFSSNEPATMFVLPYKPEILSENASTNPNDILAKLINLEPEVLLFLKNITELVWIDNVTGRHGYIRKQIIETYNRADSYDICFAACTSFDSLREQSSDSSRSGSLNNKTSTYVVLNRRFHIATDKQHTASVSIAYKLNASKANIIPIPNAKIWVFFPTRDDSNLPFLIHGTFETPVSREKIMSPSLYNDLLFKKIGYLISDSLTFLKEKKLLSQGFIKQVLLPSLDNCNLKDLHELINSTFKKKDLLPSSKDAYISTSIALVAIPFDLPQFINSETIKDTPYEESKFVDLSDVSNSSYFVKWLIDELDCRTFTLFDFASLLLKKPLMLFGDYSKLLQYLSQVLDYSSYRNSRYDDVLEEGREMGIPLLQKSAIILTQANTFASSKDSNDAPLVFFESKNSYQAIPPERTVAKSLEADSTIREMLEDHFGISKFDNKLYVTQRILPKYIDINIDVDDLEHVSDIKAILSVIKECRMSHSEVAELLKNTYLLKAKSTKDNEVYFVKGYPFFALTKSGINIKSYFESVLNIFIVEDEFYSTNGISYDDLFMLGVRDEILLGTDRTWGVYYSGNPGKQPEWHTNGDFRWKFTIESLIEVLVYISTHPDNASSRQKSATIVKILQDNETKLSGTVYIGGSVVPNINNACSEIIKIVRNREATKWNDIEALKKWSGKWLYTQTGKLVSSGEISKYDLDIGLYGKLRLDSGLYKLLGFAEGSTDKAEATFREYSTFPKDKRESFFQTAWDHGELKDWLIQNDYISEKSVSDEESSFPSIPVKNMELLQKHVRESIFCANPVKYEKVLRSIRISKNFNSAREYLSSMYAMANGKCICQMCQEIGSFEAVQIEKAATLELDQINLCLCPTCAEKYRQLRNDDSFIDAFIELIMDSDPFSDDPIEILCCTKDICFAQTHLAEIQEIISFVNDKT